MNQKISKYDETKINSNTAFLLLAIVHIDEDLKATHRTYMDVIMNCNKWISFENTGVQCDVIPTLTITVKFLNAPPGKNSFAFVITQPKYLVETNAITEENFGNIMSNIVPILSMRSYDHEDYLAHDLVKLLVESSLDYLAEESFFMLAIGESGMIEPKFFTGCYKNKEYWENDE